MPQSQQKYHYILPFKIIYQEKMLMVVVLVVYSGNGGAIIVIYFKNKSYRAIINIE